MHQRCMKVSSQPPCGELIIDPQETKNGMRHMGSFQEKEQEKENGKKLAPKIRIKNNRDYREEGNVVRSRWGRQVFVTLHVV